MANLKLILVAVISVVYFIETSLAQCDLMFAAQRIERECPKGTDHGDIEEVCDSWRNYIHCFEQAYMGCQIPVTQQLKLQRAINQVDTRCGASGLMPQMSLLIVCILGFVISRKNL